ncbi:MAG TPA: TIGR03560 family F420-dependent LLM class oxidoreductase [bacterium]|nr:TIGR03560 family F420-dependent LLM class oxidoreductase [bacterium]
MAMKIGVHIGSMTHSMDDLLRIYRMADEAGLYWASVSDHLYANPLTDPSVREIPCFEGISTMAAIAAVTKNVRVGSMMICVPFRNPALLAKAIVSIDHISGGRVELGVGAGWFPEEFEEYGYRFPPVGERFDMLEEALQILRSMFSEPVTNFEGKHYQVKGAVCAPKPLQKHLRIWIGGRGPKRTPRVAAQYADGFNTPYLDPPEYRKRLDELDAACEKIGRDPKTLMRTINVHFLMGANEASIKKGRDRFAAMPDSHRQGALLGGKQEAIDRIAEYQKVGADGLNIAFRPPVDWDSYQMFLEEVAPAFNK